jgi:zinc D-Ala-D-Ala carboxypeptidase
MKLSQHFTFAELTRTSHAHLQQKNQEEAVQYMAALTDLTRMLEVVRARFGPVVVTSGFRGPSLNALVKGSATSQHCKGEAADIVCPATTVPDLHKWIVTKSGLAFGQCILEMPPGRAWVHLSLGAPYRPAARCGMSLFTDDGKSYTQKKY